MKQSFIFVVAGMALLFSTLTLAKPTAEQMQALKHVSPMPNLMMVVMKNAEELDLNERQQEALKAHRQQVQPQMKKMVKAVMMLEKQLHDAAVAGAPGNILRDITGDIFDARAAIIKSKLACRNRLAQVLGQEKMTKLIELYRAKD